MFRYIAEDIAFLLIKNKIVDIEEREVYVYGLEVLLLNISNIIIALIISLITKSMWHFVAFILIFVPLRIFVGGYHAKTSEICFIYTSLVYALTVLIIKLFPLLNQNIAAIIVTTILLIPIMVFSPLENSNNPLGENRKRNKWSKQEVSHNSSTVKHYIYFASSYPTIKWTNEFSSYKDS